MRLPAIRGPRASLLELIPLLVLTVSIFCAPLVDSSPLHHHASLYAPDLHKRTDCAPVCKSSQTESDCDSDLSGSDEDTVCGSPRPESECDGNVPGIDGNLPGIDQGVLKMREWGKQSSPNVFWSGRAVSGDAAQEWGLGHEGGTFKFQMIRDLEADEAHESQVWWKNKYRAIMWKGATELPTPDIHYWTRILDYEISQAYAETTMGVVFLVIDDDDVSDNKSWDTDYCWGGYEWPALTRNPKITHIFRVSPKAGAKPRLIWTPADGPQGAEPKGAREPTVLVPVSELGDVESWWAEERIEFLKPLPPRKPDE